MGAPGSARAQAARDSAVPSSAVTGISELTAFAEAAPRRPLAWGLSWDPARDPRGAHPYLFLVGADSTVWLQAPDGTSSRTDAYVSVNVARTTAERTGYADALREASFVGFGHEGGRVFLYLRQGAQTYAVVGGLLALIAGTVALVVWLSHRLRRERIQRSLLFEANRRLVEAREDERLRIAQDLHDGPVQDLSLVNLWLATIRPGAAPGEGKDVAELQNEVLGVVREIRTIAEDLRPPTLGPFGLASALGAYAERFETLYAPVRARLDLDSDGQMLPERVRLALFRIAQEAMTNAAKHGRPAEVHVTLRLDDARVLLEVADDGDGYAIPEAQDDLSPAGHYGLLGMRERAGAMGARFHVESALGRGTKVCVEARRDAPEWAHPSMRDER